MKVSWRTPYFLPLLSGLLLTLAFPPFHFFIPAFVALVPMFYFLERTRGWREVLTGSLIMGLAHNVTLLYWTSIFTQAGFIFLMGYLSLYVLIWSSVHRYLLGRSRGLALVIAPFAWVCLEYLKGIGELAFTWGQLAYSLTGFPLLLQFADSTGPYGISLWIAVVNVLVFLLITADRTPVRAWLGTAIIFSFICVAEYGMYRYDMYEPDEFINVGLVQPGLDQDTKWNPAFQDSTIRLLSNQSREVADRGTDLIIWPETAVPTYLKYDLATKTIIAELVQELECPILLGAPHYEVLEGEYRSFNTALLYNSNGILQDKIYKKTHLVPFGERTPWEDKFDFLKDVDLGGGHFTPGNDLTLFELDSLKIGTLICFESIFPEIAREWRNQGAGLLVNITNDAWFKRTSAPFQHAAAVVLRAIENRVSIARSANTGVSLTVDPLGRIRQSTPIFVRTSLQDRLPLGGELTLYTRMGDLVVILCWFVLLLGVLIGRIVEFGQTT